MSMPSSETGRLPPHSLLKQRYLIVGLIGRGGMGAVYQAIDTQGPERRVAIKEMSQTQLSEAEAAAAGVRFLAEAALLGRLSHPALPRVYDAFGDLGRLYLVMDFIEGQTLFHLLKEAGGQPLPVGQVLAYAEQLCSVLAYLHQQQPPIIFRDLKPANVIVTARGHVFLIDFGIARLFKAGQPQDTLFLGSPGYAPPEQHGLAQTTPRSDLYSLGVTLYTCLTGRDPTTTTARFLFPPIRQSNLQVPEALDQLIQHMVAVEEQHRPASAFEVHQALQQILQQGGAPTERLASLPPTPPDGSSAFPPPLRADPWPVPPLPFGHALAAPSSTPPPLQATPGSPWSPPFRVLFGLLLALTIGGSVFAFNLIPGSDHLVEFSLALLFFLVLLFSALLTRTPLAWGILALAGAATLVAGFALLEQATFEHPSPAPTSPPLAASTLNLLLTGGFVGAALASLLWLTRPLPWRVRLALGAIFGGALLCALLQFPAADTVVTKHIVLLISGIALIHGGLLAAQLERWRRTTRGKAPSLARPQGHQPLRS